jgi:hypothetical protein
MTLGRYRVAVRQCDLAERLCRLSGCCDGGGDDLCNRSCHADDVPTIYAEWRLRCTAVPGSLSLTELTREIDRGRPVQVGARWADGGDEGHLFLVHGWVATADGPELLVFDPDEEHGGAGTIRYGDLVALNGQGVWSKSWKGLRPGYPWRWLYRKLSSTFSPRR